MKTSCVLCWIVDNQNNLPGYESDVESDLQSQRLSKRSVTARKLGVYLHKT